MTRHVKRLIDLLVAGIALVVLAPVMVIIAAGIRVAMGSPILFRQIRPGYRGQPFELVKFRTLREGTYADGRPLPVNQRLTPLGRFLRRSSLDELPELWNIIKGDMSLVGPRPLLMQYTSLYTPEQARRHEVRPGLTGMAQANGRHFLRWQDRFALDVWYVDNWSLSLDFKIMGWTIKQAVTGKGVAPADADDYFFTGTEVSDDGDIDDLVSVAGDGPPISSNWLQKRPSPLTRTPVDSMETTEVQFCIIGPGDQGLLAELFSDIGGSFFRPHAFTAMEAQRLADYSGRDVYAMLLDAGRPVAYGMLRGWDEGFTTPSAGIAVRNSARGTGYGRLMMAHLHTEARARGAVEVRLRVHPDNVIARRLYESLGYEYRGTDRGELVMVVDIRRKAREVGQDADGITMD